jgi:hypothetical protein
MLGEVSGEVPVAIAASAASTVHHTTVPEPSSGVRSGDDGGAEIEKVAMNTVTITRSGFREDLPLGFISSGRLNMVQKIEKVDVWAGEIRDEAGGLAAALSPLVAAGADFSFLIARRKPESPSAGVIFVGGIRGAKQKKAAQSVGLMLSADIGGLRIKATDKPGLVHQIVSKLAAAGINLRGVSASVDGSKCLLILAFDGAADRVSDRE